MNKHAYLIMAHNNFEILEKTLKLLDDEKNDFYIHIDKKVKSFDFDRFKNFIKRSKIFFIDRIDVKWGDYSQIQCEMALLKRATKNKYSYYHLISGVDMPIKSKNEIYNFFEKNNGKEYIQVSQKVPELRYRYYHFFPGYPRSKFKYFFALIEKSLILLQRILKVNRIKEKNVKFGFGANWFSITDNFAKYVLEKESWIKDTFKFTSCCDEIFLQTLLLNSTYNIYIYIRVVKD